MAIFKGHHAYSPHPFSMIFVGTMMNFGLHLAYSNQYFRKKECLPSEALLFKFHIYISAWYFVNQASRGSSQLAANCALYRLA